MRPPRSLRLLLSALALAPALAFAQGVEGLTSQDIEQRNAAVGFVHSQAAFLGVLRVECGPLLPGKNGADEIARRWWIRNRDELDAAQAWLQRFMGHIKATDPALHRSASLEVLQATSKSIIEQVRISFRREVPDADSCRKALQRYDTPEVDLGKVGSRPGFERFGEFAETLRRVRAEPDYAPGPPQQRTFDLQVPINFRPVASLDAADKARELHDGASYARIYASMAERGDGKAAQTLGVAHYRGDLVAKDDKRAYLWFWRAYLLGDLEGLNAMGVMWRDAQWVGKDPRLAYAAFMGAAGGSRDAAARERARTNATRLAADLPAAEQDAALCMRIPDLDRALAAPLGADAEVPQRRPEASVRIAAFHAALQPACP